MTTHIVPWGNQNGGYPMYFQIQELADEWQIDIAHHEPIEVGDEFKTAHNSASLFTIKEIVECREPGKTGKNHHAKGIMWYRVNCSRKLLDQQ